MMALLAIEMYKHEIPLFLAEKYVQQSIPALGFFTSDEEAVVMNSIVKHGADENFSIVRDCVLAGSTGMYAAAKLSVGWLSDPHALADIGLNPALKLSAAEVDELMSASRNGISFSNLSNNLRSKLAPMGAIGLVMMTKSVASAVSSSVNGYFGDQEESFDLKNTLRDGIFRWVAKEHLRKIADRQSREGQSYDLDEDAETEAATSTLNDRPSMFGSLFSRQKDEKQVSQRWML